VTAPKMRHYFASLLSREGRRARRVRVRSPGEVVRFVLISLIFVVVCGVGWWWHQSQAALLQGHEARWLQDLTVRLSPGEQIELGRKDLGQMPGDRSAEERHLVLHLDAGPNSNITIRNIAHTRKLLLQYEQFETFAERFVIPAGPISRLYVAGGSITFRNVTETSFDLEIARSGKPPDRSFHYDSARGPSAWQRTLGESGGPACADLGFLAQRRREVQAGYAAAQRFIAGAFGSKWEPAEEQEVVALGGPTDCMEVGRPRIGQIGQLGWRTLKIVRLGSIFMIAPVDANERNTFPITFASWAPNADETRAPANGFSAIAWPLDHPRYGRLANIIAGRTKYKIELDKQEGGTVRVHFRPVADVPVFTAAQCGGEKPLKECPSPLETNPGNVCGAASQKCRRWSPSSNLLAVQTAARSDAFDFMSRQEYVPLRLGLCALAFALAVFLSGAGSELRQRMIGTRGTRRLWAPRRAIWPLLVTSVSIALVLLPDAGVRFAGVGPFDLTIVNWCLAGIVLLTGRSAVALGLLWIAAITLAAVGSINLSAMALDGETTHWTSYAMRHKYLFLDLAPPLVIAIASCPVAALRPIVQEMVVGTRAKYRLIRWLPTLGLVGVFAFWFFRGGQTGLGPLQPAEAGKFAAVLLAASVLLRFDADVRRTAISREFLRGITSILLLLAFFIILITVPFLRNDWSPILIMCALMGGLLAIFLIPVGGRLIGRAWSLRVSRHQVPMAFRPRRRRRWWRVAVFALLVIAASPLYVGPTFDWTFSLVTGMPNWPDTLRDRLLGLENQGLRAGRRLVPMRIIAWLDLDYAKPRQQHCRIEEDGAPPTSSARRTVPEPPMAYRACYRDIEWQVILSREVVARANCGLVSPLQPDQNIVFRLLSTISHIAFVPNAILNFALPSRPVCDAIARQGSPSADVEVDALQSEFANLRPIQIPVVESDFAAAYLIGRFGIGSALLLYLSQALLLAVAFYGFMRVNFTRSGNRIDAGPRRFLGVVVAGAALLLLLQWMLSWANVLGLLPVMGQPMTWLSYAISHHIFIALPCLIVIIVGLRYAEADRPLIVPRGVPRSKHRMQFW
jgi:cell division protein FtsW (lipid II flippase)